MDLNNVNKEVIKNLIKIKSKIFNGMHFLIRLVIRVNHSFEVQGNGEGP